nr:PREDICTED: N-acetylglucosamine-6-sulfatase-like isoform X2 [Bemisia tabaci]
MSWSRAYACCSSPLDMLLIFFLVCIIYVSATNKPNIVLILTDDQDISSIYSMPKTQKLIADVGASFVNSFCSTPICCPSRSSILTGQYLHNHGVFNNSRSGGCYSAHWRTIKEPLAFPVYLQSAGYKTFYAGKYLNQESSGIEFLQSVGMKKEKFLMVLATSAPHDPFTPESKYKGRFNGTKAPRTPNFNTFTKDKHWLLRLGDMPLPDSMVDTIDTIHARRLETLLSVDDMVEKVVLELKKFNVVEETVIIFTSDNGYHLGQFSLPWDKRQPYEFDIRVPLFIRGPSIKPKSVIYSPVVNIDLAPTILDLAGISTPDSMDGSSWLPLLKKTASNKISPRTFLVEYHGEGNRKSIDEKCGLKDPNLKECRVRNDCKCQDARNNTYFCLRSISETDDLSYCEFQDSENFIEYYDLKTDQYQLNNLRHSLSSSLQNKYSSRLKILQHCSGPICNELQV